MSCFKDHTKKLDAFLRETLRRTLMICMASVLSYIKGPRVDTLEDSPAYVCILWFCSDLSHTDKA